MPGDAELTQRLAAVQQRIGAACRACRRDPGEITLLAASKTRSVGEIEAMLRLGQHRFGENYADEARAKIEALAGHPLEWHYIGPIQSNKTRILAENFAWVQSVDRAKIVNRLQRQRPAAKGPLNVLIQVNIDDEPQKSGCAPDQIEALAASVQACRALRLRGLMSIPAIAGGAAERRTAFQQLRGLFEALKTRHSDIDTLSMGMSDDLESAIAEGSTMVRVGSALFGPRQ